MTNQSRSDQLKQLIGHAPDDLLAYFVMLERDPLASLAKRRDVNLLSFEASIKLTGNFLEFHPVVQALGGIALDYPNTSNHHFYLSAPALKGSILYLSHDDETRVVYPSPVEFIAAVSGAEDLEYLEWDEIHPLLTPTAPDQVQLSALAITALDDSQTEVLTAIIPSLDFRDRALLERLARNDDFFVTEAIAIEVAKRPSVELKWLADLCASHPHQQAASAGRRAQNKIEGLP